MEIKDEIKRINKEDIKEQNKELKAKVRALEEVRDRLLRERVKALNDRDDIIERVRKAVNE